jgi:hypothetical protein
MRFSATKNPRTSVRGYVAIQRKQKISATKKPRTFVRG